MNRKLFWILAALLAWFARDGAKAQQRQPVSSQQPDCMVNFTLTVASTGVQAVAWLPTAAPPALSAGTSMVIDNRLVGCLDWEVTYSSTGLATLSLLFQTAPTVAGVPGTWAAYGGTLSSGINPNTVITQAKTETAGDPYAWLRMNLTAKTGTGTITGNLYGWKRRPVNISGGTITATTALTSVAAAQADATTNTPRVLADGLGNAMTNPAYGFTFNGATWDRIRGTGGYLDRAGTSAALTDALSNTIMLPNASGAVSSSRSIPYIFNGTTWDRWRGTSAGGAYVQGSTAIPLGVPGIITYTFPNTITGTVVDGVNNAHALADDTGSFVTTQYVRPSLFNGNTWDRQFYCNNQVLVTLTDATVTALVPVSSTSRVRVCHAHATTSGAPETFSLIQGTGVACAGAPATIDTYLLTTAWASDYTSGGPLRTAASNGLCVSQSGAAQTSNVFITYAQF